VRGLPVGGVKYATPGVSLPVMPLPVRSASPRRSGSALSRRMSQQRGRRHLLDHERVRLQRLTQVPAPPTPFLFRPANYSPVAAVCPTTVSRSAANQPQSCLTPNVRRDRGIAMIQRRLYFKYPRATRTPAREGRLVPRLAHRISGGVTAQLRRSHQLVEENGRRSVLLRFRHHCA
jgi:hypothetical protein